MAHGKKVLITKVMLLFSGVAFLLLITSASKLALCGCAVTIVCGFYFLWNNPAVSDILQSTRKPVYIVLGFFVCCAAGSKFYSTWVISGKIQKISEVFSIEKEKLGFVCVIAGVIAATPVISIGLSFFIEALLSDVKNAVQKDSGIRENMRRIPLKKSICMIAAVYMLGIIAILRANFYYVDDMGRAYAGYKDWARLSRFLSETLSSFIHMDNYLTDVSPLPQMAAVLFLAFSGIILLYVIYGRAYFSIWELLALVPLGLNPYFLECISYKYDAPYMALSVLAAVWPLLYMKRSALTYISASMIGTIAVCTSYQAATGIYPMLVILLMLKMWISEVPYREIGSFCLRSLSGFGLGMAFFKIVILLPVEGYMSSSMLGIKEIIPGILNNLKKYYTYVGSDMKGFWLILIAALVIGFLWTIVYSSKQKKYLSAIVTVIATLFMGVLCFGMYPVLEIPSFAPRAMYGFGVFITILAVCTVESRERILLKLPAVFLSWTFFVFSFTYGNALYVQKEYTDYRIRMVIDDLKDMDAFLTGETITVQLSGSIGQSPVIRNMPQDYQILNRLVPITFRGNWYWGDYGFGHYYGLKNIKSDSSIDLTTYNLPILEDNMFHTIRGKDNYVLIEIK